MSTSKPLPLLGDTCCAAAVGAGVWATFGEPFGFKQPLELLPLPPKNWGCLAAAALAALAAPPPAPRSGELAQDREERDSAMADHMRWSLTTIMPRPQCRSTMACSCTRAAFNSGKSACVVTPKFAITSPCLMVAKNLNLCIHCCKSPLNLCSSSGLGVTVRGTRTSTASGLGSVDNFINPRSPPSPNIATQLWCKHCCNGKRSFGSTASRSRINCWASALKSVPEVLRWKRRLFTSRRS
mmetsp:Transcript_4105/g.13866  ORF Transcript_4105/g.13866 Transcript_4105/m.13866 type:complete len:240 (+) Transcript_4105:723-1442(+)